MSGRTRPRMVALCGIDGAGKSTQAASLVAWARDRGLRADRLWCRWDPLLARPAIRVLDRYAAGAGSGFSGDQDRRRSLKRRVLLNPALRAAWRSLMVVDYGILTCVRVRRARRRVDLLVLDRYWHDVMVDLAAGDEMVRPPRLLTLLLPKPDLMVVLDLPEQEAASRHPEPMDLTYLRDRARLYRDVAAQPDVGLIDASRPEAVVAQALQAAVGRFLDGTPDPRSAGAGR